MKNKQIILDKWKGKSGINIVDEGDFFECVEYRKGKDDKIVKKIVSRVPYHRVNTIWNVICDIIPPAPQSVIITNKFQNDIQRKHFQTTYDRIVLDLIQTLGLIGVTRDSFNGGRNRAKYYFPLYYYPLKVLEYYNLIRYKGRGKIIRLSEELKL